MRQRISAIVALVIILIVGLGGWYINLQRIRERSYLSGFFQSTPANVSSRTDGRIRSILVNEGDSVHMGQPLVLLNAAPQAQKALALKAQAQQSQAAYLETLHGPRPQDIAAQAAAVSAAQANLDLLIAGPRKEDIAQGRSKLQQAQAIYQKDLNGPRPQEIAEARAAAEEAAAALKQTLRGPTQQERAEAAARYKASEAQAVLAHQDVDRYRTLYLQDAVSRQQYDEAVATYRSAQQNAVQLQQALQRTTKGSTREQIAQAKAAYDSARAALDLQLAGTRPEQIAADLAARNQARAALEELIHGSRPQQILQARAELMQQEELLSKLKAGSRAEEIAQSRAQAMAALAQARSSEINLSERVVRAPTNGIVDNIPVAVGDLVQAGATLLRLDTPQDIWLKVYIPERDLALVTVGDDAQLRVDGIRSNVDALVESVASQGEFTPANLQTPEDRGKQVFAVKLRLAKPNSRIKPGIYATVLKIGKLTP